MAELVELMVVPHDPTLPGFMEQGTMPGIADIKAEIEALRERFETARPDVVVMVGSDHFSQWFLDNMPAFLVGKASVVKGPFPDEQAIFGLASFEAPCDQKLARAVFRHGMASGVDFASSDEFTADHSFSIPLNYLCPDQQIPVVPVFTNVMAPPLPRAARFHRVGEVLREAIESYESDQRVAVVTTAHMANRVGSPSALTPAVEWDQAMWKLIAAGAVDELLEASSFESLYTIGANTLGFLNWSLAFGVAGSAAPTRSLFVPNQQGPGVAFLEWDQSSLAGGNR